MILVVGATGSLGSEVCKSLAAGGHAVRAMVRADSAPERVELLRRSGAETIVADLTDRKSLDAACEGIRAVVSTATSVSMRREGDSFDRVDQQGQIDLVHAAAAAGVEHFVYVSFPAFPGEFPLQTAKRAVEDTLRAGSMAYTILQPPHFWDVWVAAPIGVNPETGAMRTCGGGAAPISWIAMADVRDAVCASLATPKARNRTLKIGGGEALSQLDIIGRCERLAGRPLLREDTPRAQIDGMAASGNPLLQTLAGLMLVCAEGGCVIDNGEAADLLSFSPRSIDDHLAALVSSLPGA